MCRNSSIAIGAAFFLLSAGAHAADMTMPIKAPLAVEPPAQLSGYVELYAGWARTNKTAFAFDDDNSERRSGWPLGGAGRGTWWFAPNASLQLDVQGEGTSYRTEDERFSTHAYLIGGHLNWRDSRGLIGIFGGGGDAGGHNLSVVGSSVRHGLIGAEAQVYWNAVTLYLQGGYDSTIGKFDPFINEGVHAWFIRGTGRWFVTPNLLIEATGLYANGEIEHEQINLQVFGGASTQGFQTWLWQAKVEWRPGTTPFSLFAKYQGSQTRWDDFTVSGNAFTQRVTDQRVLLGLRLYVAEQTLLSNDRKGTTLDIIDPLGVPSAPTMFGTTQGFFPSDQRLKRDIELITRRDDGLGVYRYRYLWSDEVYVGVMAQEVAERYPSAVVRGADGYLRVNYAQLGMRFATLVQWNALGDDAH